MSRAASQAFAPAFAHTSAAPDVTFTFATSPTSVTASVPTETYRMWLAPSADDFLRVLAAQVAAALSAARSPATYTCIASLAADGVFTLRIVSAGALPTAVTFAGPTWRRCGFASATPSLTASTGLVDIIGTRPVWHLGLIAGATGHPWQPKRAGGACVTTAGAVYAVAASRVSWHRTLKVHFQPRTPDLRASLNTDATAMYPADEYFDALGSTSTAREWSLLDLYDAARNTTAGYTGDWITTRTDAAARIWRVSLAPEVLLSPEVRALREEWHAYTEHELGLVAPSSAPTETRA